MRKALLGLLTIAATIFVANGDIIPTLSGSPVVNGSNFTWNYAANVTVDQMVTTGDFFTIYDFGKIVAGSNLQPAGWTFSSSLVGPTPANVLPGENALFENLTWTYTGTTPITGAAALGNFSVVTDRGSFSAGTFAAQGTRSGGPDAGTTVNNIGSVSIPLGPSQLPEMSALLPIISVCGAGFVAGIPAFLRRRKNS